MPVLGLRPRSGQHSVIHNSVKLENTQMPTQSKITGYAAG